ncbi:MAG: ROK family protein [bacterium]|nr:ROK family protein [bacterium]
MHLLFDIGGTKIRVAFSDGDERFEEPVVEKTLPEFDEAISLISEMREKATKGRKVSRAVCGIPGVYDKEKGELVWSPNLPGWKGRKIKKEIEEAVGVSFDIVNDADLVGLGEAVFGAGKGFGSSVYVTVSTGVGGGLVALGQISKNVSGFEPGQQIVGKDGETLEYLVGGGSFKRRFGKSPKDVTDPTVWQESAEVLSVGLYNTIMHCSPDVLVLGGPMILGNPAIPFDIVAERTRERVLQIFPKCPEIKKAELGDFGGLYGGLAYLRPR